MPVPPTAPPLLTTDNLSITHRKGSPRIVDSVTLTVPAGVCAAIVGPNGAGKSTLLRALAGLGNGVITGQVALHGAKLSSLSAQETARWRAFVPQENPMPFAFTVREAIGIAESSTASVDAALSALDLTAFSNRSVLALSGGERQRVAIARAFAQEASVLLLDEPTAHQDMRYSKVILDALRRFVREQPEKRAVIAVLHDLNLAATWADQVFLIHQGRLICTGSPDQVFTSATLSPIYATEIAVYPFIHAEIRPE